jgi:poly(A) polymerase
MVAEETGGAPPSLAGAEWLARPATRAVFAAITVGGEQARAVGGAVRNALVGRPVTDIDIATTALPQEVMRLAAAAGLAAVPTGLAHGTVTVISEHMPYEVTTLRRDVETFGRHAHVTFTRDWTEDARRRDFTLNALYCDADGTVHDPLGGWADLVAGRVRFIGDAHARIREDFLRILRFFRFTAQYARGAPDAPGLAACVAERGGLALLSGERIRAELLRLLAAPRAVAAVSAMDEGGILGLLTGRTPDLRAFERLAAIEDALGRLPDPVLRLGALAVAEPADAARLQDRLRLSREEADRFARAAVRERCFDPGTPENAAQAFLYRHGPEAYRDAGLIAWARASDPPEDGERRRRLELPSRWSAPALPVRGADVVALGVAPGPDVGRILAAVERWWIEAGFPADEGRVRAALADTAARRG